MAQSLMVGDSSNSKISARSTQTNRVARASGSHTILALNYMVVASTGLFTTIIIAKRKYLTIYDLHRKPLGS